MLRNYLKVAFRNLVRRPAYSVLAVISLAAGISCCVLIALFVEDELGFDRFHEKADRIYYVVKEGEFGGEHIRGIGTSYSLAIELRNQVPQVESVTQTTFNRSRVVRRGKDVFFEEGNIINADEWFFDVFSFRLTRGDARTALSEPYTVVISQEAALRYFGEEDPLGQTLRLSDHGEEADYRVTGVVAPPSGNSSITFDFILSALSMDENYRETDTWGPGIYMTYLALAENHTVEELDAHLAALTQEHVARKSGNSLSSLPLTNLYLSDIGSEGSLKGDRRYIFIFSAIASVILLIASINYMNLATARSARRVTEVGVRKTVGASRSRIALQFLVEAVLTSLIAFVVALALARLSLPFVNDVFDKSMTLTYDGNSLLLPVLLGITVIVGLLSGSYPAMYLASFNPIGIFTGRNSGGGGQAHFRRGLIVVQFAISIALIAVALTAYRQIEFIQQKDLGFSEENLVTIRLRDERLSERYQAFKQAFLRHPNVTHAAATTGVPGRGFGPWHSFRPDGAESERKMSIRLANVDDDYLETLGIRLSAGRNFSPDRPSDLHAAILNESAVSELGWTDPIGRKLEGYGGAPTIIGVVEDFHVESLHDGIRPIILQRQRHFETGPLSYPEIVLRLGSGDVAQTLSSIREAFEQMAPDQPFLYDFVEDEIEALYHTEHQLGKAFTAAALVAVLVACLGLFGLAVYAAENRKKEIAIRKVNGATEMKIVGLLVRETLVLVLAAFIIAAPIAYMAAHQWLERFAYRVDVGIGALTFAGALAVAVAMATVMQQALSAARTNPAMNLRSD